VARQERPPTVATRTSPDDVKRKKNGDTGEERDETDGDEDWPVTIQRTGNHSDDDVSHWRLRI